MVDEDQGKKEESEAILRRREQVQQFKGPFFDPGMFCQHLANISSKF